MADEKEKAKRDLRIQTADQFLAQAAKEYQDGRIDQPLWRRAEEQSGHDPSLVIAAYLRARATALQLQHKQAAGKQGLPAAAREADPPPDFDMAPPVPIDLSRLKPLLKYAAGGALALIALVAIVWFVTGRRETLPVQEAVTTPTPAPQHAVPGAPLTSLQPPPNKPSVIERPAFEARVQELTQAGNWNVLVLYASDWARKEPLNAAAWHELSVGYAKVRQFDDALQAATKAVQLAPQDALLWSNVGQVNLSLERLPEAKIAFDKALAIRAEDPDALCGAAFVAQKQGRRGEADALAARIRAPEAGCRGVTTPVAVTH